MRTITLCSWCTTPNDAEQRDCVNCGHDAHVPRSQCACAPCSAKGIQTARDELREVTRDLAQHVVKRRAARGDVPGPTVPADKIDHIAAGRALQYIVYYNLTNWPDQYVLRCFSVHDQGASLGSVLPLALSADLGQVRAKIPPGYVNVGRNAVDASCVVEIWV